MIGILFSCEKCGLVHRKLAVRPRETNETVKHWIEEVVGHAIGTQHRVLSPACPAQMCSNVILGVSEEATKAGLGVGHQMPGEEPFYPNEPAALKWKAVE